MPKKPLSSNSNQISQVFTTMMKTIQAKINFPPLKKGVSLPQIKVKNGEKGNTEVYPLIGDRYVIGRSSKSCDIFLRNPLISQIHCIIEKDPQNPSLFFIKDQNSTNGIYFRKQRYNSLLLRHGDLITLGAPELQDSVEIRYLYPPALWLLSLRYSLYGLAIALFLILLIIGNQWSKYDVNPLPHGIPGAMVIYSDDGKTPLREKNSSPHRELKKLSDFSPYLPLALIASEDSRYYWHFGVDPLGITRALIVNLQKDSTSQGASTITQQLARSIFPSVGRENTLKRKLREMMVALKLEAVYSKDYILKNYLNRVYLGVNIYGFEDAARFYFNKSASEIDLNEAATLVAILPAPNAYNPIENYDTAINLRNRVLTRMYEAKMITETQYSQARRSRVNISSKALKTFSEIIAPYFYSHLLNEELDDVLGRELAKEGDFIIETALNPTMQEKAEQALTNHLQNYGQSYRFSQGAIVTLDTKTGEILALVGGEDYGKSQFNRATQAQRQPGSTFKVFAYSAALEKGISPYKTYSCTSLRWQAMNYKPCERSSGNVDMYRGIAQSENAIALRVAKDVGLDRVIDMAKRNGIQSPLKKVPGLILGESEVNVLEITGSYATFANQGIWNRPHGIKTIRDGRSCQDYNRHQTCRPIYTFNEDNNESRKVISSNIAQTMTTMMQGVIKSGTGKAAFLGKNEAGKTGTTNRGVDLWFIGYLPQQHLVTGIWLGNDNNSPTKGSSSQAASLWSSYMKTIDIAMNKE